MASRAIEINVKVLGAELIAKRLSKIVRSTRDGISLDLDLISADLLSRAADLSPILTGDLIRSGRVARQGSFAKGAITRAVAFGTNHAVFAHEARYNLGPISRLKPSTEDGAVGRKFLERPFRKHSDRYLRFLRDEAAKRLRSETRGG